MRCPDVLDHLHPFLDGELSDSVCTEIERHLENCADCRMAAEAVGTLDDRLRRALKDEPVPAHLWSRIQGNIVRNPVRVGGRWAGYAAAAAVLLMVIGGLIGTHFLGGPSTNYVRLLEVPVNEMRTFVDSRRPMDFVSTDPNTLRSWFVGKLDFAPPPPVHTTDLALIGGRLCYFLERRVASYMYRSGDRLVSLYVMPMAHSDAALDHTLTLNDGEFTHVLWQRKGLFYSLVSDLPKVRLQDLAEHVSKLI